MSEELKNQIKKEFTTIVKSIAPQSTVYFKELDKGTCLSGSAWNFTPPVAATSGAPESAAAPHQLPMQFNFYNRGFEAAEQEIILPVEQATLGKLQAMRASKIDQVLDTSNWGREHFEAPTVGHAFLKASQNIANAAAAVTRSPEEQDAACEKAVQIVRAAFKATPSRG